VARSESRIDRLALSRLTATKTGDAISEGGYANTGIHVGDVVVAVSTPASSRYLEAYSKRTLIHKL
jgi:hypothetical protein